VRELGSGISRIETLEGLGIRNITIAPNIPIEDGIQAVRNGLARTYIHEGQTRLIEALRQYQRDWDERSKTWRSKPKHDHTSHTADSLRYLFVGYRPVDDDWNTPIKRNLKGFA
jgi:hypothetical protein